MNLITNIFRNKTIIPSKLIAYGFENEASQYVYRTFLPTSRFQLIVYVSKQGEVTFEVLDPNLLEPYTLHLIELATGGFVSNIREECEDILNDIANRCFKKEVFKWEQTQELLNYVRQTYGDLPEFLWEKSPENAILRRKDNKKWYGLFMRLSTKRLGIPKNDTVEILTLRVPPEEVNTWIDNIHVFPGYHMNKKHWCTILLDGTVPLEALIDKLEISYQLASI